MKPGEIVGVAEIDHLRALRNGDVPSRIDDFSILHNHHAVLDQGVRFSIEQSRPFNNYHTVLRARHCHRNGQHDYSD